MSSTSVVTCTWVERRRLSKAVVWLRSSGVECWYNCISWGGTGVIMIYGWVGSGGDWRAARFILREA